MHGNALRLQAFWQHGVACATASQCLARQVNLNEGAAFTAGLLHDVGRLVLDSLYPDDMRELQVLADQQDLPAYLLEQRHFGVSHTELGSELARRWHFASDICEAIAMHHEPALSGPVTLTDAVHLGNAIAHALDVAGLPQEVVPNIRSAVWERLRLDDQCLPDLLRDSEQQYRALQAALTAEPESRP
jgi:putative nucleotidyltransferase with HDIG domain